MSCFGSEPSTFIALLNVQSRASDPRIVTVFVRDEEGSLFQPARPSFHLIVAC